MTQGLSLDELAALVGGRVQGDGTRRVVAVRPLEEAGPEDLSLLTAPRYRPAARDSRAGAILTTQALAGDPLLAGRDLLLAEDPGLALIAVLGRLRPPAAAVPGIHPTAVVDPTAQIDASATVGPYAVIGAGSTLAVGAVIGAHVVIGAGCRVGAGARVHPHAVLYDDTELGDRVIVHGGAVLGADGFGYVTAGRVHHKVPQVGRVVVEADVEVGANTTIDRATLGETRIGAGTKIDNLVQVGHNVRVGPSCVLCGQAGIAGSAELGTGVVLAGQSGVSGHIEVGDGTQVAAKSALLQSSERGARVAGIPAVDLAAWRRQASALGRLPALFRRVRSLEKKLGEETSGE